MQRLLVDGLVLLVDGPVLLVDGLVLLVYTTHEVPSCIPQPVFRSPAHREPALGRVNG